MLEPHRNTEHRPLPAQVDELDIHSIGPLFESHPVFPARTNTEFIEVRHQITFSCHAVLWGRGASNSSVSVELPL